MAKVIGLTGPSGAGKSTAAKAFRAYGAHTIDADIVARNVVTPGKPALKEIVTAFGKQICLPDGTLNRKALAKIVFNDRVQLHKLNTITHKYIEAEIKAEIEAKDDKVVVVDAAVLFESGMDAMCQSVVSVLAEKKKRIERIKKRDNLDETRAKERIEAQPDDAFYREKSDFVIENNGDETSLFQTVEQIVKKVCCE